jgi:UDP-glucose 4-epimerase
MVTSVLITGATGYIGAHVVKELYRHVNTREVYIEALDIDTSNRNYIAKYCHILTEDDVRNFKRTGMVYDVVIHLAGLVQVAESMEKPYEYYDTNLNGTINILKNVKCKHFIFASTAGAFDPVSPYAKSKVAAEDVIRQLAPGYTIFRFFNVAGSNGEHRQYGPSTHLIRVAAEAAAGKRKGVTINGGDYPTRDGTCIRDYIHVVDLAKAIVNAALSNPKNAKYECLGSNKGFTNLEVLDIMKEVTGKSWIEDFGPRREGDPAVLQIDGTSEYLEIKRNIVDMCRSAYEMELK